jgi:hypothetical protein
VEVEYIELDEVMRRGKKIPEFCTYRSLWNYWKILSSLIQFDVKKFKDIIRLTDGYDIQDAINSAYSNYSIEDTAFIVRSNKRANQYNEQIELNSRQRVNCHQAIFMVQNNYFERFWSWAGFIANGISLK